MTKAPSQPEPTIRRATRHDAPNIAALCRSTFQHAPEWRAPSGLAAAWWRRIIASDGCPVHVAQGESGQVLGFVVEIADPACWKRLARTGPHRKTVKLLTALRHPSIIRSRIRKARRAKLQSPPASDAHEPRARSPSPDDPAVMFLELLVVTPEAIGRGVARKLLETVERNTAARGHSRVQLVVDPRNARAQAFYLKHGYIPAETRGSNSVMMKTLPDVPRGIA